MARGGRPRDAPTAAHRGRKEAPPRLAGRRFDGREGALEAGVEAFFYQVPPPPASQPPPPTRCKVPRTKGMKLRGAEKALRRAHCRVGRIKHVRSKKIALGRVISTSPGVGRRCAVGHKIEIFVSKGAR